MIIVSPYRRTGLTMCRRIVQDAAADAYVLHTVVMTLCNLAGVPYGCDALIHSGALRLLSILWDCLAVDSKFIVVSDMLYHATRTRSLRPKLPDEGALQMLDHVIGSCIAQQSEIQKQLDEVRQGCQEASNEEADSDNYDSEFESGSASSADHDTGSASATPVARTTSPRAHTTPVDQLQLRLERISWTLRRALACVSRLSQDAVGARCIIESGLIRAVVRAIDLPMPAFNLLRREKQLLASARAYSALQFKQTAGSSNRRSNRDTQAPIVAAAGAATCPDGVYLGRDVEAGHVLRKVAASLLRFSWRRDCHMAIQHGMVDGLRRLLGQEDRSVRRMAVIALCNVFRRKACVQEAVRDGALEALLEYAVKAPARELPYVAMALYNATCVSHSRHHLLLRQASSPTAKATRSPRSTEQHTEERPQAGIHAVSVLQALVLRAVWSIHSAEKKQQRRRQALITRRHLLAAQLRNVLLRKLVRRSHHKGTAAALKQPQATAEDLRQWRKDSETHFAASSRKLRLDSTGSPSRRSPTSRPPPSQSEVIEYSLQQAEREGMGLIQQLKSMSEEPEEVVDTGVVVEPTPATSPRGTLEPQAGRGVQIRRLTEIFTGKRGVPMPKMESPTSNDRPSSDQETARSPSIRITAPPASQTQTQAQSSASPVMQPAQFEAAIEEVNSVVARLVPPMVEPPIQSEPFDGTLADGFEAPSRHGPWVRMTSYCVAALRNLSAERGVQEYMINRASGPMPALQAMGVLTPGTDMEQFMRLNDEPMPRDLLGVLRLLLAGAGGSVDPHRSTPPAEAAAAAKADIEKHLRGEGAPMRPQTGRRASMSDSSAIMPKALVAPSLAFGGKATAAVSAVKGAAPIPQRMNSRRRSLPDVGGDVFALMTEHNKQTRTNARAGLQGLLRSGMMRQAPAAASSAPATPSAHLPPAMKAEYPTELRPQYLPLSVLSDVVYIYANLSTNKACRPRIIDSESLPTLIKIAHGTDDNVLQVALQETGQLVRDAAKAVAVDEHHVTVLEQKALQAMAGVQQTAMGGFRARPPPTARTSPKASPTRGPASPSRVLPLGGGLGYVSQRQQQQSRRSLHTAALEKQKASRREAMAVFGDSTSVQPGDLSRALNMAAQMSEPDTSAVQRVQVGGSGGLASLRAKRRSHQKGHGHVPVFRYEESAEVQHKLNHLEARAKLARDQCAHALTNISCDLNCKEQILRANVLLAFVALCDFA